jgi:uncharacterized membrane protein
MGTTMTGAKSDNGTDRRRGRRSAKRGRLIGDVNVGRGERLLSTIIGGLLTVYGLRRRGRAGYGIAVIGAEMLYRGTTGHCHAYGAMGISRLPARGIGEVIDVEESKAVDVRRSIEIARPREELFAIWRDFSNLPRFMAHLDRVDVLSATKSHWVTKGPAGIRVEWDAEIVDERENEWIAWQAVEPAEVPNNGTVMFRDTPSGDTEIFVTLEAQPPGGKLGELVARMFGKSPDRQVRTALEKFKEMAENSTYDWSAAAAALGAGGSSGGRGDSAENADGAENADAPERANAGTGRSTKSRSRSRSADANQGGDESESHA